MYYQIAKELTDKLPDIFFGAVAVRGLDNSRSIPEISAILQQEIAAREAYFETIKVKEDVHVLPYREAFRALSINPNKFPCSIEALLTRIAKKKGFPSINAAVDLGNALSLRYFLPIGAHDLSTIEEGLDVRPAIPGDTFVAFGETEKVSPDPGEIIYVSGNEVRTRRWTWRQSEIGKITEGTTDILFPIDGFHNFNEEVVRKCAKDFASSLNKYFGCECFIGFVDKEHPRFEF